MKKLKINLFTVCIFFIFSFILFSCAPSYIPNVANTPLFSNRGEFQASVHTGVSGFDPQLSYALTDHIGFIFNGSFADRTSDTTDNFHKHQYVEFGAGYYNKIGKGGRFEVFGGCGFGKVMAFYENELWYDRTNVSNLRFFIQPTIGATTTIFDGSFTPRFVLVNFSQETAKLTCVFMEPTITARFGYKNIKTVFQLGFSLLFNSRNIELSYQPILFSIGLQFTLGKKYE